jgi:septation ring formation regulator EzrA
MAQLVEVYGPSLSSVVAADCARLKKYQEQLEAEIALTALMSNPDLEKEFTSIASAFDAKKAALQKTEQALKDKKLDLASSAVSASSDLLWHVAVFSGNPTMIGVAAGVEVTTQTGKLIVQVMQAKETKDLAFAFVMHVKDRTKFVADLVKAQKQRPVHERYLRLAKAVFKTLARLGQAGATFADVQAQLEEVRSELLTIDKGFTAVVVNIEEMRKYQIAALEGARDFVAFVRTVHGTANCQATHILPNTGGIVFP